MEKITYTVTTTDTVTHVVIEVKYSNGDQVEAWISKEARPGVLLEAEIGRWCVRNGINPYDIHLN